MTSAHPFDIPNALRFEEGAGGRTRAVITTASAEGEIYLHGAHITQWKPAGQKPVLYLSPKSLFERGKAIRGGVPVIFPWFGPRSDGKPGPMHGFARTKEWSMEGAELRDDGAVRITLALAPDDETRALGFDAFSLRFRVTVGAELEMELETRNESARRLVFEEALHTYFAIGDVHQVSVSGLEGATYIDKTDNFARKIQESEPVRITRETDRLYVNTTSDCVIHDPAWKRRVVVRKSGSASTVVWNPWIEKTKSLADMAPDDWTGMICVETANAADNAITLEAGALHTLRTTLTLTHS